MERPANDDPPSRASRRILYVSHADVAVDPAKPVPRWSLSETGRRRHEAFGATALARSVTKVYSSDETKALEAARAMFPRFAEALVVCEDMHENDRSATGFLPPGEFEAVADRFFATPEASVRGWERAVDAQARIVAAFERVLAETINEASVALVGHGGVGTLLFCHLAGRPIERRRDQPANNGGNVLVCEIGATRRISPWVPMEDFV